MMLSDESLSEDFTFDFKQAKLLVKKIRFMKENKLDYKDLSIKEMTDKEFSNFLRWKEEIVYGEMGCNPTEECLVGMWEMWKHLHKPIDEDELDDLSYDVGEEKSIIYGYDNEYDDVEIFCNGFKHGLLHSRENKYSV